MIVVFFFQAEDGIREIGVTGVQTCALPIFVEGLPDLTEKASAGVKQILTWARTGPLHLSDAQVDQAIESARNWINENTTSRSEERRVGKERRSRWPPYHYKKIIVICTSLQI